MVQKDWKRTHRWKGASVEYEYTNKENKSVLTIIKNENMMWYTLSVDVPSSVPYHYALSIRHKHFKTKSSALKFAKAYMRKH